MEELTENFDGKLPLWGQLKHRGTEPAGVVRSFMGEKLPLYWGFLPHARGTPLEEFTENFDGKLPLWGKLKHRGTEPAGVVRSFMGEKLPLYWGFLPHARGTPLEEPIEVVRRFFFLSF
ncbi:MAG: hypothetical protein H6581_08040 [Bacteroidia bacterium]|nr:hypothetical protein [Bacteroidia bacterium]